MTKVPMDHLRSRKQPVTRKVTLAGDTEVATALREAQEELRRVEARNQARVTEASTRQVMELQQRIDGLTAEYQETSITFTFRSIGRKRYEKLMNDHAPTDEQRAAAGDKADQILFNSDTFPMALIMESLVDPRPEDGQYEEFASWIEDDFNNAEFYELWLAAFGVHTERAVVSLGKG